MSCLKRNQWKIPSRSEPKSRGKSAKMTKQHVTEMPSGSFSLFCGFRTGFFLNHEDVMEKLLQDNPTPHPLPPRDSEVWSGKCYWCWCCLRSHFSFFQCKHILAVYLSQAMGVTQQEAVSDRHMSTLLSGAEATWPLTWKSWSGPSGSNLTLDSGLSEKKTTTQFMHFLCLKKLNGNKDKPRNNINVTFISEPYTAPYTQVASRWLAVIFLSHRRINGFSGGWTWAAST